MGRVVTSVRNGVVVLWVYRERGSLVCRWLRACYCVIPTQCQYLASAIYTTTIFGDAAVYKYTDDVIFYKVNKCFITTRVLKLKNKMYKFIHVFICLIIVIKISCPIYAFLCISRNLYYFKHYCYVGKLSSDQGTSGSNLSSFYLIF